MARLRLGILVVALVVAFFVFTVSGAVSVDEVRALVERAGWAGPLLYAVIGALLGAVLVPGPILAGASGVLFGPALGFVVTLASALGTSLIGLGVGRVAGREGARSVLGEERSQRIDLLLDRHGVLAVAAQRLAPGVPDAPASYAFGAFGLLWWQMIVGSLIGSAPRAFAYTAIGASLDDPTSPLAAAGLIVWVAVAVAGAAIGRRVWVTRRQPSGEDR